MIDWQRFKDKVDLNIFKRIFNDCLAVSNEKVLIIGDYGWQNKVLSPILTNAYALAARELNLDYNVIIQNAKVRGDYADEVMVGALKRLPPNSVIVLNISNRIGKLVSIGSSFRSFCHKRNHKFITSSSLGSLSNEGIGHVLRTMDVDYKKMNARGERIKKILDAGREVHISSKIGTDLTMDITGVNSIVNSGKYTAPGAGGNLPAGEVYLYPVKDKVQGQFYIDGSMRLRDKTLLVRNPVKVEVEKGEITNISNHYEGKLLQQTLEWAHRKAKHPWGIRKIAELGIGINPNAKLVGATIIDEKMVGTVHIANGSNAWFGGEIFSIIHLDHVLKNPIVRVDGRLLKII